MHLIQSGLSPISKAVEKAYQSMPTSLSDCQSALLSLTDNMTDTKVNKIGLYTLSFLSGTAGMLIAGGLLPASITALIAAVPLYSLAGAFFWYSNSLIDYNCPKALEYIRQEAQKQTLPQIIEKHGWEKLFSYEILSPEEFKIAYSVYVERLSFNEMIQTYERAEEAKDLIQKTEAPSPFHIPSPMNWKAKFKEETESLKCEDIVSKYSVEKIGMYKVVTEKELDLLKKAETEVKGLQKNNEAFRKEISESLEKSYHKYTNEIDQITAKRFVISSLLKREKIDKNESAVSQYAQFLEDLSEKDKQDMENFGEFQALLKNLTQKDKEVKAQYTKGMEEINRSYSKPQKKGLFS